jgi:hypothetical protein
MPHQGDQRPCETRSSASLSSVGIITSPLDVPHGARFLACSELEFLRTIFKKSHPEPPRDAEPESC